MNTDPIILISRVIDNCAGPADWAQIEAVAEQDPTMWRDLALARRDHDLLTAGVREQTACAERVEIPDAEAAAAAERARVRADFRRRMGRVSAWAGWAAAAAVGFAFLRTPVHPSGARAPQNQANVVPGVVDLEALRGRLSAEQARSLYLEKGQQEGTVISELPTKVLYDASRTPDGKAVKVIFIRQIMEQTTVPDLYRYSSDELGNPTPVAVPVKKPVLAPAM